MNMYIKISKVVVDLGDQEIYKESCSDSRRHFEISYIINMKNVNFISGTNSI